MPAPSTGIIDDFNRANGGLGADYSVFEYGGPATISSNRVTSAAGSSVTRIADTPSAEPVETYMTVISRPVGWNVAAALANDAEEWYAVYAQASTRVYRISATGAFVQLGANISVTWADGDQVGIYKNGSTIEAWRKPAAGSWTLLATRTDSTYSGPWMPAFDILGTADDLGGGPIVTSEEHDGGSTANVTAAASGFWRRR